jgi:hypothetical protein
VDKAPEPLMIFDLRVGGFMQEFREACSLHSGGGRAEDSVPDHPRVTTEPSEPAQPSTRKICRSAMPWRDAGRTGQASTRTPSTP